MEQRVRELMAAMYDGYLPGAGNDLPNGWTKNRSPDGNHFPGIVVCHAVFTTACQIPREATSTGRSVYRLPT